MTKIVHQTYLKTVNQRIKKSTLDKINILKRYVEVDGNISLSTLSDAQDFFLDYFIKREKLDIKTDITIRDIKINDNILKKYRVDNNFSPSLRHELKTISSYLYEEGVLKKKLNYEELTRMMMENYLQQFPKIQSKVLQDRYIYQKVRLDRLSEKKY